MVSIVALVLAASLSVITEAVQLSEVPMVKEPIKIVALPPSPKMEKPTIICSCEDRPGKYAAPMKAISDKIKELSKGLDHLGKRLGKTKTGKDNNDALKSSFKTAGFASRVGEMLQDVSEGKAHVIIGTLKGVSSFIGQVKELLGIMIPSGTQPGGNTGTGIPAGSNVRDDPDQRSIVVKLNFLANNIMTTEAIIETVESIAKSSSGPSQSRRKARNAKKPFIPVVKSA